jgi:hypothetical protein
MEPLWIAILVKLMKRMNRHAIRRACLVARHADQGQLRVSAMPRMGVV